MMEVGVSAVGVEGDAVSAAARGGAAEDRMDGGGAAE